MTGKPIMVDTWKVRNAYRNGVVLSAEELVALIFEMKKGASSRQRNMRRTMSIGEVLDAKQIERGRKSAERHRRKTKWMKRELTEAEKLQLQSAWGS